MYRTKMREQQLSGWPPREPDTRRFVEKKEHRGDGETAIRPAAGAGRKNRQRTALRGRAAVEDRSPFCGFTPRGAENSRLAGGGQKRDEWTRCESS